MRSTRIIACVSENPWSMRSFRSSNFRSNFSSRCVTASATSRISCRVASVTASKCRHNSATSPIHFFLDPLNRQIEMPAGLCLRRGQHMFQIVDSHRRILLSAAARCESIGAGRGDVKRGVLGLPTSALRVAVVRAWPWHLRYRFHQLFALWRTTFSRVCSRVW